MNRFLLAVAVGLGSLGLAAGGFALAASSTPPRGSLNQQALVVLRHWAACIRQHGVPAFPDPTIDTNGVPVFPNSAPRTPVSAQRACASIYAQMPAGWTETQPVSLTDYQKLLVFARCMRTRIPDWPDPNRLGEFPIDAHIQQGGKRLFVPAAHACARLNPNPSGGISVVRAP
ncbi:MAG: hypothetical protein JO073_08575 [Actinobacteria bacterium]|nr:hypothetical protein [Actinomycetota bacterium]